MASTNASSVLYGWSLSGYRDYDIVLTVSVSINIYMMLFLGMKSALSIILGSDSYMDPERACEKKVRFGSWRHQFAERQSSNPKELPRLFLDTLVTIPFAVFGFILIIAIQLNSNTDLTWFPGDNASGISKLLHAARYVFAVHLGLYICNSIQEMSRVTQVTSVSHHGVHLLHHVVTVCFYMIVLLTGENIIFAACGLVMELDQLFHKHQRVLKQLSRPSKLRSYVKVVLARLVLLIMVKFALPISILISSWVTHRNIIDYNMTPASLAFLIIGLLFFPVYNFWLLFRCVKIVQRTVSEVRGDDTTAHTRTPNSSSKSFLHINKTIQKLTQRIMPKIPISTFHIDLKEDMKQIPIAHEKNDIKHDLSPTTATNSSDEGRHCISHSGPCLIRDVMEVTPVFLLEEVNLSDIADLGANSHVVSSGSDSSKKPKPIKACRPHRNQRFDPANLSTISEEY